jgi:hypothetical protein
LLWLNKVDFNEIEGFEEFCLVIPVEKKPKLEEVLV